MHVMPKDLLKSAYSASAEGVVRKFDDQLNAKTVAFMRELMHAVNTLDIEAFECYHSMAWDRDKILEVLLEDPHVEFWSVHAPYGAHCDPSSPLEDSRAGALAALFDAIEVVASLKAKVVVAHPSANVDFDFPRDTRVGFAVDIFKEAADRAGEHGIGIAIEPLPKNEIGNSLDEVLRIVEKVDRPNVGVNFDVNHLFPPEAIPSLIRRAGSKILSVHISDQDGVERHWLPFEGKMDWREVLKALTDVGYTGPLIYETHIRDARDCDEAGRIMVDNYSRLIQLAPTQRDST